MVHDQILSCYFMIKTYHNGLKLFVTMFYDLSKHTSFDFSEIFRIWNKNGINVEEYRTDLENRESRMMRVLFWSNLIPNENINLLDEGVETSIVNYDILFEFMNYTFTSRYMWDYATHLRYCELQIVNNQETEPHVYKLDSKYLDTCISSKCDSVAIVLNLYHSSSMMTWPESSLCLENSKNSKNVPMNVIVCDLKGIPYSISNVDDMRLKKFWNNGFLPIKIKKNGEPKFDFKWLFEEFGILIQDDLCMKDEGIAIQTSSIILECESKTRKYINDINVIIYEKPLTRNKEYFYKHWTKALKEIQNTKNLFLNNEKYERIQEMEVYLPSTVNALVNIISESNDSMKSVFSQVLEVQVEKLDNVQELTQVVEELLKKKLKIR